ncbi:MAG: hypothetical protein ACYDBJ_18780 [Aggregatilineales bacterium]
MAVHNPNDDSELRKLLTPDESLIDLEDVAVKREEDGRIFGLNAVERMILSFVLFMTVTVLGIALLFITGTIVIR